MIAEQLSIQTLPQETMKTVANLGSLQQAQNLKLMLGSMGIDSFIPDERSAVAADPVSLPPVGCQEL